MNFDENELNSIEDSNFPINFSEEIIPLDMFGICIKKDPMKANISIDSSDLLQNGKETDNEAELYSEQKNDIDQESQLDIKKTNPEEIIVPFNFVFDEETPVEDFSSKDTILESIDANETDFLIDKANQKDISEKDTSSQENSSEFISIEEFNPSDFDVGVLSDEIVIQEEPTKEDEIPPVFEYEDIDISMDVLETNITVQEESDIEQNELYNSSSISFDSLEIIDVDSFDSEKESNNVKLDFSTDDDFSSFLDDLNTQKADIPQPKILQFNELSSDDDLDLDSFIDSFNESGSTSHEQAVSIFEDTEPVDLDLEFDESYIEETQKIKDKGSLVTETEFSNLEFGVEFTDETEQVDFSDFDFDFTPSVNDENDTKLNQETSSSSQHILETTSEFDEFLTTISDEPSPNRPSKEVNLDVPKVKKYDLTISEEDETSINTIQSESTESEDSLNVFFYGKEENLVDFSQQTLANNQKVNKELVENTQKKDYNESDIVKDTDFSTLIESEDFVPVDFDDIEAVERDLEDNALQIGEEPVVTNDKSTELLLRIAEELSSIKQEISILKKDLVGLKISNVPSTTASPENTDTISENSGFFSDDDPDETIALTGDELNNILITADFTEEKTEDSNIQDTIVESSDEEVNQSIEFPENIELSIDTNDIEIEEEIPDTLPDSILNDDLSELDIEITPITSVEEDVSYLEGNETDDTHEVDVSLHEPDIETIDFSDENLEEPSLEEFDLTEVEQAFPDVQEITVPEDDFDSIDLNNDLKIEDTLSNDSQMDSFSIDFSESLEDNLSNHDDSFAEKTVQDLSIEDLADDEKQISNEQGDTAELEITLAQEEIAPTQQQETPILNGVDTIPLDLKEEIKSVLSYMDQLLESLPEEKIEEFARSEHFEVYKKLFGELGIS